MEKRYNEGKVEIRMSEGGSEYIEGYGIVFNTPSHVMTTKKGTKFREIILPEAVKNSDMTDVIGRGNHTNALLLGRTASGTMTLRTDEKGVYYRIKLPNTTAGKDMKEYISRGDIVGSSFAFSDPKDKVSIGEDGIAVRTITELPKIFDIGPVISPAYPDATTQFNARSVDEAIEEKKEEKEVEVKAEAGKETKVENKPLPGMSLADKVKLKRLRG